MKNSATLYKYEKSSHTEFHISSSREKQDHLLDAAVLFNCVFAIIAAAVYLSVVLHPF